MDQSSVIFISIMSAAGLAVLVFAAFLVSRRWKRRRRSQLMDEMEGHDFEYFCADLSAKKRIPGCGGHEGKRRLRCGYPGGKGWSDLCGSV